MNSVQLSRLPSAWKAAVQWCPYCSGTGCRSCDHTGDLFGSLLQDAYERGRKDTLRAFDDVGKVRSLVRQRFEREAPTPSELKAMMR